MYQYHPNMQSIIFPISIYFYILTHYYIIYLESHYSKIQNNLCLTFFPWTNDGFWTLGLDGGTGRSKEAGALHWWMGLFTHWLQKDLILAGKQQAPEADKALLKRKKKKKSVPLEALGSLNVFNIWSEFFFFLVFPKPPRTTKTCQVSDHLQPGKWTGMDTMSVVSV